MRMGLSHFRIKKIFPDQEKNSRIKKQHLKPCKERKESSASGPPGPLVPPGPPGPLVLFWSSPLSLGHPGQPVLWSIRWSTFHLPPLLPSATFAPALQCEKQPPLYCILTNLLNYLVFLDFFYYFFWSPGFYVFLMFLFFFDPSLRKIAEQNPWDMSFAEPRSAVRKSAFVTPLCLVCLFFSMTFPGFIAAIASRELGGKHEVLCSTQVGGFACLIACARSWLLVEAWRTK